MEGQFALATLIKKYLLALPDPIVNYSLYDKFIEATIARQEIQRIQALKKTVKELSPVRYDTLKAMCSLFYKIQLESKENMMTPDNLGTAVGPSILRGKYVGSSKSLQDIKFVSQMLATLSKYYFYIFEDKSMTELTKELGVDTTSSPIMAKTTSFTGPITPVPLEKKESKEMNKMTPPPLPKRSSTVLERTVEPPPKTSQPSTPITPITPIKSPPPKPHKEIRPYEEIVSENQRLVHEIFAAKNEIVDLKIMLDQARDEIQALKLEKKLSSTTDEEQRMDF